MCLGFVEILRAHWRVSVLIWPVGSSWAMRVAFGLQDSELGVVWGGGVELAGGVGGVDHVEVAVEEEDGGVGLGDRAKREAWSGSKWASWPAWLRRES